MSAPRPPRIAVALEYDGQGAPRVTAKGRGELAERIVETGRAHDVAVEQNAVLAQALSAVELDDEIPQELYRATAQVIAFVLSLRGELGRRDRDGVRT
ncbi:MAG: EscU/YscU/HrcU family type III secretion system export apparatus switch protein [Bosea sp. (in: a-proteobacteria)]|uniref:EscU/YscU/HrcU family type III secretion system export apparatus switch protein n=1 Tax=unclassified Bosea (in: a-proteobacteria) TaxID=2653178 RepID=UPI00095E496E|nr:MULTISPECIES: EscU/YscU/HrcU family type III secretion system export apparatus switch protein [unclassified Bosea (in: a-proteobacteria)]MBN9444744.1 EscU/YscU/HrcU family type III secretion system export apparatus switch protein [Bosea sp. (in: a-proteobacteria)]MBN9456044.1 EscU/YscU/HrcU family type III secretion system export apparatus switch protein [Bosea sp. (in: a-proteobacteria)]OJV05565.1 MAG: type III secretion protein [Bosea sp. 67-29]